MEYLDIRLKNSIWRLTHSTPSKFRHSQSPCHHYTECATQIQGQWRGWGM